MLQQRSSAGKPVSFAAGEDEGMLSVSMDIEGARRSQDVIPRLDLGVELKVNLARAPRRKPRSDLHG